MSWTRDPPPDWDNRKCQRKMFSYNIHSHHPPGPSPDPVLSLSTLVPFGPCLLWFKSWSWCGEFGFVHIIAKLCPYCKSKQRWVNRLEWLPGQRGSLELQRHGVRRRSNATSRQAALEMSVWAKQGEEEGSAGMWLQYCTFREQVVGVNVFLIFAKQIKVLLMLMLKTVQSVQLKLLWRLRLSM